MSKTTRVLSGTAKNLYLDGVVKSALGDDHAARERLMSELTAAIASLRIRVQAERGRQTVSGWSAAIIAAELASKAQAVEEAATQAGVPTPQNFDPFTPNVIVILRTQGRDAALSSLAAIVDEGNLRLLAHEQQLGVPSDATTMPEIRAAIVAAAERRVANRQAAGR